MTTPLRGAPPPPAPCPLLKVRTCSPQSNASKLPFCDTTKSMKERADALVASLTLEEKISTFELTRMLDGIPRLGIVPFRWDATDIEGVADSRRRVFDTHHLTSGAPHSTSSATIVASVSAGAQGKVHHATPTRSSISTDARR